MHHFGALRAVKTWQIILARLVLLVLVLGAWEVAPRAGYVNSMLLPPLSDVLAMLKVQIARPAVQEAILVTALEVVVALTLPFTAAFNINQVSPLVFAVVLAAWTILYVRRTKARGQERRRAAAAAAGQEAGVPSE